ncbi:MAG TPA: fibronectin type III domain-containing protein [Phycisphaerales bacterium]|nr:fibronectin type III domain-containing protein [Phycisphaerales bacterium]
MATVNNNPIPRSPRPAVQAWGRAHAPIFVGQAEQLGLPEEQAALYKAAVDELDAAVRAQEAARNVYRTATTNAEKALARLLAVQGDTVRIIRAYAESTDNPQAVYSAGQLPPIATPTKMAEPAQPRSVTASLVATSGAIELRWKAKNPEGSSGTSYIVRRRLPGEAAFTIVGITGKKRYTDSTLPAGHGRMEYTIQGQRSDLSGPVSALMTVSFGAVEASRATRLAA